MTLTASGWSSNEGNSFVLRPFRTDPPISASSGFILRSRLLEDLAHRFDTRLTTIVASPGSGKTVLLAQAIEQNRMVPTGQDYWISCDESDSDHMRFGTTILQALDADRPRQDSDMAEAVVEAVWAQAPFDVVLFFDDFHRLDPESSGVTLVQSLLQDLPSNGHVLISSRSDIPFAVSRMRAAGDLAEVGQADLAFDDAEYEAFLASRPADPGGVSDGPRQPALATLLRDSGPQAVAEFLSEEVVAQRPREVQRALGLIGGFASFDPALLAAVMGSDELSCVELTAGLPLVLSQSHEHYQLHALWATVTGDLASNADRADALRRGGEHLLDRGDFVAAARAFASAHDDDGLLRTATAMCFRPLTNSWVDESREVLRLLPAQVADTGLGRMLEAFAELELRHQWNAMAAFELAAEELRASNLQDLEVQALVIASQLSGIRFGLPPAPHLYPRACELAGEGDPLAMSMVARFDAYAALTGGDPELALSYIDRFDGFGPQRAGMLADQLRCDCGRPELVGDPSTVPGDLESLAAHNQVNIQLGYALWVRGEITPDDAVPVALDLIERATVQRISHQRIHIISIAVIAAVAAANLPLAEQLAAQNRQLLDPELGNFVSGFVQVGEMALALGNGDEARATEILRKQLDVVSLATWPPRPYHHVLSPIYVLIPDARPLLDSLNLGPALAQVIAASRALVLYREHGDDTGLATIDWRRLGTLRANISLPHLAEMALGAGVDLASDLFEPEQRIVIPRRHLNELAKSKRPVAGAARDALGKLTGGPSFALRLNVLGPMELLRDGKVVDDDNWIRRERVRMLCGFLVHHPITPRRDVAAALWPDLDEEKALSNLRVNLRLLLGVFEPERPSGGPSWFVDSEGPTLSLRRDRIEVDVVEFDALIDDARRADDRGIPGQALSLYEHAAAMYTGDYLESRHHDQWVEFERIRFRSSSALAGTRVAELLLARGEPEASIRYATNALRIEPLLERAHRCRVRAFVGQQDRGAAREAGRMLMQSMTEAGLAPEPDSMALLNSLGLDSSASEATPGQSRR